MRCDVCGKKLTKGEEKVYEEISDDAIPCYCDIARGIYRLRRKCKKYRKGIRMLRDSLLKEVRGNFWTKSEIRQIIKNTFDDLLRKTRE